MLKVVKTLDLQTAFNNARVDVVWLKFVFSTWLYSTHWLMLCYNVNLTCGCNGYGLRWVCITLFVWYWNWFMNFSRRFLSFLFYFSGIVLELCLKIYSVSIFKVRPLNCLSIYWGWCPYFKWERIMLILKIYLYCASFFLEGWAFSFLYIYDTCNCKICLII